MLSGINYDDSGDESVSVNYRDRTRDSSEQTLIHMFRPCEADFALQLEWVSNYAALRMERSGEIMTELTSILPFLGSVGFLHPDRMRRTSELLTLVLNVTGIIEMRVKHALACRRPTEYSPQIQPMIPTPGHGSLPSGHATESFAAAFVFYALIVAVNGSKPAVEMKHTFVQLMRIAERIAINRTVAGVHFPADSVAGMVLGQTLAEFYLARCGAGKVWSRTFDGRGFEGDFCYENVRNLRYVKRKGSEHEGQPIITQSDDSLEIEPSKLLKYLWSEAIEECTLMIHPRAARAR
jgi:membrane-associated phospholipid phosphatase